MVVARRKEAAALVIPSLIPIRRTFTLREFAALSSTVAPGDVLPGAGPADRLRALVPLLTRARSARRLRPDEYDVPDPYRRGGEQYLFAMRLIRKACDVVRAAVSG